MIRRLPAVESTALQSAVVAAEVAFAVHRNLLLLPAPLRHGPLLRSAVDFEIAALLEEADHPADVLAVVVGVGIRPGEVLV